MDCSVRSVRTRSRGLVPRLESHVGQTWLSRKWRMMHARQNVCRHSMMVPVRGRRAVESAALEAASSSTRGSGWAFSGPAFFWRCPVAQSRQARPGEAQQPR
eukprot:scaffold52462_cov71-Phaeocystis_antarctica.AAC.1